MSNLSRAAFIVLAVAGCGGRGLDDSEPLAVNAVVVQPEMISRTLYAPCRLEAGSEAVLSVSVPSVVEDVLVQPGDTVTAGDRLLVLRTDDMRRAAVFGASAVLEAARASSEYAGANLSRADELLENGAISPQEHQMIETGARASEASYLQALAGYSAAVTSAGSGYVTAPFSGTVGRVMATQGNPASGPLLSIFSGEVKKAELLVAPRHMTLLRPGLPAVFMTDHFPGELFPGTVTSVSPSADPVSGLVALSVQFLDSSDVLVPGLSGLVMVSLETADSALVLGESALTPKGECCWEAAVVRNGTAHLTEVRTGIASGNRHEIIEGLLPGDTVITLGHTLVSNGQAVRLI